MKVQGPLTHRIALGIAAVLLAGAASRAVAATADPERPAIDAVLERSGLLADPLAATGEATFGARRVTHVLHSGAPSVGVTYGRADESGRPREATVVVSRWLTGSLEIRERDARGRDQVIVKDVRDSCARQVTLRRMRDAADPAGAHWRIASMSAWVGTTPSGRAMLPLVDLDTHGVSSGFLSTLSDLDELAVYPQTCAVTAPGDSVRVLVGGLDADAAVCVFAGGQRIAARRSDASHAVAMLRLDHAGLAEIGVTVYTGRTLSDAAAPADSRTWVLPILVGAPPTPSQEWFAL